MAGDFAAVHADDAYLDELGSGARPGDELSGLLAAWRDDVDGAPMLHVDWIEAAKDAAEDVFGWVVIAGAALFGLVLIGLAWMALVAISSPGVAAGFTVLIAVGAVLAWRLKVAGRRLDNIVVELDELFGPDREGGR